MHKHKKWLFSLMLLLSLQHMVAQKYEGIRHVGLTTNVSDFGYMAGLQYQHYFRDVSAYQIEGYYEYSNRLAMQHQSFGINGTYLYDPLDSREQFVFLVGGGVHSSFDQVDQKKELGSALERQSFNIGLLAKTQLECYVTKRFSMSANLTFNYNFITKFAPTKFWGGISFNYLIF